MGISKLFGPFKRKLFLEGFLKSLLSALISGAFEIFAISLFYHIRIKETPWLTACIIGTVLFVITFFVCFFFVYYPKRKKVARRIDDLGLQERASTLLEYRKETSEVFQMQRRDAVEKITSTDAKQLKLCIHKAEIICCAVCLYLAVCMAVLPYDVFAFGNEDIISAAEQEQNIKDLIERLREEVRETDLDDDLKESLNDIIDKLEEDLKDSDSELEQAAKIEQTKQKMQELLDKAITKDEIGEALQKYELTRALGEAISKGNSEKVSATLEELEGSLNENKTLVKNLSDTLIKALEDSGVEESDTLYTALLDFSSELSSIDTADNDFKSKLSTAFDNAETNILAALEKQATIESEKEKLEESMDEAKDEALGNEKKDKNEDEEGEKPENGEKPDEEQSGEKPEGEMPEGEMPEGSGEGMGEGEGTGSSMTEGIYDPVSGSVAYGEVFAAYYAEYLEALESGNVSEELQEIIDKYYSKLN